MIVIISKLKYHINCKRKNSSVFIYLPNHENLYMSIIKFLASKTFLKQLALAIVAIVFCFIMLKWLNVSTNHGEFETVPDLTGNLSVWPKLN